MNLKKKFVFVKIWFAKKCMNKIVHVLNNWNFNLKSNDNLQLIFLHLITSQRIMQQLQMATKS